VERCRYCVSARLLGQDKERPDSRNWLPDSLNCLFRFSAISLIAAGFFFLGSTLVPPAVAAALFWPAAGM
ncbi:MAG: hypothetical protein ACPIOQ_76725, partial [Promethearchaeia archaeon]